MKNTFLNRVAAEREVLTAINGKFAAEEQLAGLSRATLSRWQSVVGENRAARLVPILLDLADKCQRLSDHSHETFLEIEEEQAAEIEEQIEALKRELNRRA